MKWQNNRLTGRWRWRAGLRWQAGSWMKSDHSLAQGWCPKMSQAPQNWRTASLWCDSFHLWCDFFSLFDPAGIKYKICRNLQISFSLFHPAGIKYKFADFGKIFFYYYSIIRCQYSNRHFSIDRNYYNISICVYIW